MLIANNSFADLNKIFTAREDYYEQQESEQPKQSEKQSEQQPKSAEQSESE